MVLPSDIFWRIFGNLQKVFGNLREIKKVVISVFGHYMYQNSNLWVIFHEHFSAIPRKSDFEVAGLILVLDSYYVVYG